MSPREKAHRSYERRRDRHKEVTAGSREETPSAHAKFAARCNSAGVIASCAVSDVWRAARHFHGRTPTSSAGGPAGRDPSAQLRAGCASTVKSPVLSVRNGASMAAGAEPGTVRERLDAFLKVNPHARYELTVPGDRGAAWVHQASAAQGVAGGIPRRKGRTSSRPIHRAASPSPPHAVSRRHVAVRDRTGNANRAGDAHETLAIDPAAAADYSADRRAAGTAAGAPSTSVRGLARSQPRTGARHPACSASSLEGQGPAPRNLRRVREGVRLDEQARIKP